MDAQLVPPARERPQQQLARRAAVVEVAAADERALGPRWPAVLPRRAIDGHAEAALVALVEADGALADGLHPLHVSVHEREIALAGGPACEAGGGHLGGALAQRDTQDAAGRIVKLVREPEAKGGRRVDVLRVTCTELGLQRDGLGRVIDVLIRELEREQIVGVPQHMQVRQQPPVSLSASGGAGGIGVRLTASQSRTHEPA